MYKIETCNCERYRLNQLEINYTYSFFFEDCHCPTGHEMFVFRCKISPYNLLSFARNHFASISCSCVKSNKDTVYYHCVNLSNSLNVETIKMCLKKEDLPGNSELININKYLGKCVRADPIFYYSMEQNKIYFSLDSLDWGYFFHGEETMR